jgi:hypothetical protein
VFLGDQPRLYLDFEIDPLIVANPGSELTGFALAAAAQMGDRELATALLCQRARPPQVSPRCRTARR